MKYVSLFSGIEAATVAWEPLGWEPLAFSEIDAFPCAVLAERFPGVPNLGDITKIDWKKAVKTYGNPDLVVGGSPCQSFSIAGGRTGLEGASGLMWEYVRCVREVMPRWLLWENVPGALSSSHGEDFRCLLEALDALGYGLAWRVLDAQFFGLAQRRERLFVVGSLGDGGAERACSVLFEPESLSWDTRSSREKRKELAARAGGGAACAGFCASNTAGAGSIGYQEEVSPTLRGGGSGTNMTPTVFQIAGNIIGREDKNGGHQLGVVDPDEHGAFTLNTADRHAVVLCMGDATSGASIDEDMSGTLKAHNSKEPPIVAFAANQRGEVRLQGGDGDVVGAIPASQSGKQVQGVTDGYAVRRLTPRECERLQGFPDDHTLVPYRGKPAEECPDTPRYKALGNSMAVPVMRWIGERIEAAKKSDERNGK